MDARSLAKLMWAFARAGELKPEMLKIVAKAITPQVGFIIYIYILYIYSFIYINIYIYIYIYIYI